MSTLQSHIGGSGGFEPKDVSLLHMAWTQRVGPQADTPEKWLLLGGAGQIPARLAADPLLEGCIVLNAAVKSIRQDKEGVTVGIYADDRHDALGKWWYVSAKAVIVAIPPRLRANIDFYLDPPLPPEYALFSQGSPMGSMSKVHAVYEKAFWREDCLSGSTAGNLAPVDIASKRHPQVCEFIADSSPPGGKPGILTSFIAADRNCEIGNNRGKAEELVLKDYVYYFGNKANDDRPEYRPEFFYHNWNTDSWTCGAFTSRLGPKVWTSSGEIGWRAPVNNVIFWAGTETSDEWPGYFDGAVKAGQKAATDVCEKVKFNTRCIIPA